MRTIVRLDSFGGPDQLEVLSADSPIPGPPEVRLQVKAVGVNPVDIRIRRGDPQDR